MSEEQAVVTPAVEEAASAPAAPSLTDDYSGIPENYRSNELFKDKDLNTVLDEYIQQKEVLGTHEQNGLVALPTEDASEGAINDFYTKLGKPESPAEYGFKAPEEWPEGLDYSDERAAAFAEVAHKLNLTTPQAQGLFDYYHNMIKETYAAQQENQVDVLSSNIEQLEAVWGAHDSESFNEKKNLALRAFNSIGDADLAQQFKDSPEIASHPLVLQAFARLGQRMLPDSVPTLVDNIPMGKFGDGPDAVQRKLESFHKDGKFAKMVNDPGSVEGLQYKKEWDALNSALLQS